MPVRTTVFRRGKDSRARDPLRRIIEVAFPYEKSVKRAFVERFATENDKPGLGLTEEAMLRLRAQRWPGNVRQLQNLIERLVVLASSKNIDADDLDRELAGHSPFVTEIPEAVALTGITRPKDATPAAAPTVPEAGGGTGLCDASNAW